MLVCVNTFNLMFLLVKNPGDVEVHDKTKKKKKRKQCNAVTVILFLDRILVITNERLSPFLHLHF